MGHSISISYGLVFLASILMASMLYSIVQTSNDRITTAKDLDYDREFDRFHTNIELFNVSMDKSQEKINILARNIGSESIYYILRMDVMTNATIGYDCGPYVFEYWIPSYSLGSSIVSAGCYWNYSFVGENTYNPEHWDSNEVLNITIHFNTTITSEKNYLYKIATPNGVIDSLIFNTTIV